MNSQQNYDTPSSRLVFRVRDPVPSDNHLQVFLNTDESTQDPLIFNNTLDDYDGQVLFFSMFFFLRLLHKRVLSKNIFFVNTGWC